MRFLIALDAIAQYQSRPIDPVAPAGGAGAATPSTPGDKNDDADKQSDDEPAAGGGAPPRRQDPRHFLNVTDSLFSIQWNEMGFADVQDSADLYRLACAGLHGCGLSRFALTQRFPPTLPSLAGWPAAGHSTRSKIQHRCIHHETS